MPSPSNAGPYPQDEPAKAGAYSVNQWGSHPDAGNDDCFTGEDFLTREEAEAAFDKEVHDCYVMYIELDGPDVHEVRRNPHYSRRQIALDEAAERSERAMQAGMAFGCQGYNEAMGWD